MHFVMISRTKYTKNVRVGSPAVLVRDEIHYNKYPGTRRVMNVGYPGSKISTRFNSSLGKDIRYHKHHTYMHVGAVSSVVQYIILHTKVVSGSSNSKTQADQRIRLKFIGAKFRIE